MSSTLHRVLAVTAVGALLLGCTPEADDRPEGADAVVSPLPSPVAESGEPSPAATPEPSPSPTPSPTQSPAAALDEEEALAAARARRAERADCDPGFADEAHEVVATMGDGMLVFVVCFVGAYQPSGELQLWDGVSLQPLVVEQWQFGDVLEAPEVVGFVSASTDGATIVNEVKYRGLGDCGLFQQWSFDGSALVLELAREQECDDEGEFVPPDQWPTVYER